jgi:hypothetical protein
MRDARLVCSRGRLVQARPTLAALRVSRPHQPAVRYVRNDAMRYPILSRPLSCGIAMEPIRVRGSLRCHRVRRVRACNSRSAYAATADPSFDAARKNIFACLSYLRTRAKLDLFAAALAQLLDAWRLF